MGIAHGHLIKSMPQPKNKPKEEEDRDRLKQTTSIGERSLLGEVQVDDGEGSLESGEQEERRPAHWD